MIFEEKIAINASAEKVFNYLVDHMMDSDHTDNGIMNTELWSG